MDLIACLVIGYVVGRIISQDKEYKRGHNDGYKKGHKAGADEIKAKAEEQYILLTMQDGKQHKIKLEG